MSQTKAQLVVGLSPNASAPDDALNIDSSGRVGIGTDAPSVTVEARGAQAELQLKSTSGTNSAGLRFVPGGETNALYIYADGSRNINFDNHATSLISVRASGGITFNGDTATANALDDYEEGTWTPVMEIGGSSTGITGSFSGAYTKIGRTVSVVGLINLTSKGSNTGTVTISGLPFSKNTSFRFYGPIGYYNWASTAPQRIRIDSATTMDILAGHELARADNSYLNNNTEIYFSFTYQTA